jgi:hypothetical protein
MAIFPPLDASSCVISLPFFFHLVSIHTSFITMFTIYPFILQLAIDEHFLYIDFLIFPVSY